LGTGISAEKSAPLEWSPEKNIAWKVKLPGPGNSTPIVWGDRVLLTCASPDGKERGTYCYDRKSGELKWKQVVEYTEKEPTHNTNPACSASPVTDGERVVVWHGSAGLYCYDLDGKELWKKDTGKVEHVWGYGSSPVIYKDLVILNAGPGLNVGILAFNKTSGEEVYRKTFEGMQSEKLDEFRGSWSTPVIYNDGQRDVMLVSLPEKLRALDPATGEELWSCGGPSKLYYTSPLISGNVIVAMCGYGGPAMGVRDGGSGDVTATNRLWLHDMKNPQRVGSGVVVDGHVYILNENGVAWCIEAETGKILWEERLGGTAWPSAVFAAGRVYFTNMDGTVYVIKPSPDKCELLATNKIGELMRATPAFSDGQIFLRTYENLYCIAE
jgi:outer membrane protein assembly factor BamB